jgi:excinuclease ABC subunit B
VAILDADKEGYLRSRTSLIQTIGRAARNAEGRVLLYADVMTKSLEAALAETSRRREKQQQHNAAHGITPTTVKRDVGDILAHSGASGEIAAAESLLRLPKGYRDAKSYLAALEKQMRNAAGNLEFEEAARLRDEIQRLEKAQLLTG